MAMHTPRQVRAKILTTLYETFQRDPLVMMTPSDIAEVLGESPNTISVRLHRAIKDVRSLLSPGPSL